MAVSDVSICNLGLQKLGAARIITLDEDSRNARSCNACYTALRDRELRMHAWNFATKRVSVAASAVVPAFDYDLAFPLPSDNLRLLPPARLNLDWKIEIHEGVPSILTNEGAPLKIVYIQRVTDPTKFDALFVEMLACKIAWHLCEEITQSNVKKADIHKEYLDAKAEAKRMNAFEQIEGEEPEDPWVAARRTGSQRNWLNGPW